MLLNILKHSCSLIRVRSQLSQRIYHFRQLLDFLLEGGRILLLLEVAPALVKRPIEAILALLKLVEGAIQFLFKLI